MAGTLCCAALINPVVHIYSMLGMVFWMTLRHGCSVCGKICHRSNNLKPRVFYNTSGLFNAKLASMKLKRHTILIVYILLFALAMTSYYFESRGGVLYLLINTLRPGVIIVGLDLIPLLLWVY